MNIVYNISLLALFIIVISLTLIYKYKGKPTKEDLELKEREKYQYILSKLKQMESIKMKESQDLITNIPVWNIKNNNIIY